MNNNVITNMSETMTTEEYIKLIEKRKQEDFEKQFDEELRQAREKALKEQVERAKEDYFITLVNKIADVESEIGICETILEKSDTCRIIFNIKSEKNIYSLQEINDILNVSTELSDNDIKKLEDKKISIKLCQKLIKLIGGHLMIKSNDDGTEIIFIIDQKKLNNDKKMDNQFNVINETGKVLVLSSDKE